MLSSSTRHPPYQIWSNLPGLTPQSNSKHDQHINIHHEKHLISHVVMGQCNSCCTSRRIDEGGGAALSSSKSIRTYPKPASPACIAVDSERQRGTNLGGDPKGDSLDYHHGDDRFLVTKVDKQGQGWWILQNGGLWNGAWVPSAACGDGR